MRSVSGGYMDLLRKIENRSAVVGIIGLGYVGLPLIIEFGKAKFAVIGFDLDKKKIKSLNEGRSYIKHIPSKEIILLKKNGNFKATADFSLLKGVDCIIICVPTPLTRQMEPDLSYVLETTETISKYLKKDKLIVLVSTTYPGTTDEDMRAILEKTGMKAGKDFYLAYSPEREDPNNQDFSVRTIPKVVGGYSRNCLRVANALFSTIIEKTIPVSSTKVAETTKLLENIYRAVNIALVNELKILFQRMGIDIWEVIDAAKTKPFGFQAFYPGPGLGGHCIPIDPFYLTWKAREYDFHTKFIELAGEINISMPYYVVEKVIEALNDKKNKSINSSKILVLGLAYKKDVDDVRESPSLKLIELLKQKGACVDYNDPYIPKTHRMRMYDLKMESVTIAKGTLKKYDCVVIATDHSCYDYEFIVNNSQLIVDTRNAAHGVKNKNNVVKA
jgi:UDP-N-acetyl-D-glucosamine dehydrogenase